MSTPFGKRGFFYDAWTKGRDWMRVRVPATECPRIPGGERLSIEERPFRQEYLCEFEDQSSGVFRREMVERAVTVEVAPLEL
jgi:hypothetical protein